MMTYFQFLENQSLLLLGIMLVVGTLWGFGITLGASWKEKFATVDGVVIYPLSRSVLHGVPGLQEKLHHL